MNKRIVVYRPLPEALLEELKRDFHVDDFGPLDDLDDPGFRAALSEAHGLIGAGQKITTELLDAAPRLETISSVSVGVDAYPVEELTRRGIQLCHTPDVLTETTADTGFLLIMATARRAVELADVVRDGEWKASIGEAHYGIDVHGKTLGMVGMGRIGAAIARRGALGFGMKVLYSNASPKPALEEELGARGRTLDELLGEADFVCVTVPLSAETERLIGERELGLMRDSAILVNIARGKVVDEAALIEALKAGRIRAAGLDVFEREPLPHMANVVALPHIGSATHETRHAMAQRAVDNIRLVLSGERPLSPFNAPARLRA